MDKHMNSKQGCHNSLFVIYRYMASLEIKGTWVKLGNEYKSESHQFALVIGNRKYTTENKPNQYLLVKHSKTKFDYLSGLYPTKENRTFHIDWANKDYQLTFTNDTTFKID